MSYILDALKKAESERMLGSVPNIHAPAPAEATRAAAADRGNTLVRVLAAASFVVAITGVAWMKPWRKPESPLPPHPAPLAQTALPAAAGSRPAATPSTPVTPAGSLPATAIPPNAQPTPTAATVRTQSPMPDVKAALPGKTGEPARAPEPTTTNAGSKMDSRDTVAVAVPIGTLQDLPANIQREVPAVVLNGYIYARNPADRSVLIDKNLLREGDRIAPGLVLEEITPQGAILNFNGYRYRVAY